MRRRWILIGLVVAVAVLGEVAIVWTDPLSRPPHVLSILLVAMLPSHGCLLAFWAALGGPATPWRLVVSVVAIVTWMRAPEFLNAGKNDITWLFVGFLLLGLVGPILLTARFFGLELTDLQAADTERPRPPDGRWEQFSLGSLLAWMTAVAMIMGTLHYLPKQQNISILSEPPIYSAILGGSALIALSAVWLTLAMRWTAMRCVVAVSAGAVAIAALSLGVGPGEGAEIVVFCLGQIFWTAGSLYLVRLAGYRLIWRRRVRL